jgi:putative NADH-flavin reductase
VISRNRLSSLAWAGVVLLAAACAGVHSSVSAAAEPLKIVVYGASGRVGSRIVHEALSRGHQVTGVSRHPEEITEHNPRLRAVRGDILDPDSVAMIVAGQDVVISAVGGENPDSDDPMQSIPRRAAESLVTALRNLGSDAPRMLVVGGGSTTLEARPGVWFSDPTDVPSGPRKGRLYGHRLALMYLRGISDVDWTFLSPPLEMGAGERTGKFRVGGSQVLRDAEGRSAISMEDLAVAMIDEVENPRHIRGQFTVAY